MNTNSSLESIADRNRAFVSHVLNRYRSQRSDGYPGLLLYLRRTMGNKSTLLQRILKRFYFSHLFQLSQSLKIIENSFFTGTIQKGLSRYFDPDSGFFSTGIKKEVSRNQINFLHPALLMNRLESIVLSSNTTERSVSGVQQLATGPAIIRQMFNRMFAENYLQYGTSDYRFARRKERQIPFAAKSGLAVVTLLEGHRRLSETVQEIRNLAERNLPAAGGEEIGSSIATNEAGSRKNPDVTLARPGNIYVNTSCLISNSKNDKERPARQAGILSVFNPLFERAGSILLNVSSRRSMQIPRPKNYRFTSFKELQKAFFLLPGRHHETSNTGWNVINFFLNRLQQIAFRSQATVSKTQSVGSLRNLDAANSESAIYQDPIRSTQKATTPSNRLKPGRSYSELLPGTIPRELGRLAKTVPLNLPLPAEPAAYEVYSRSFLRHLSSRLVNLFPSAQPKKPTQLRTTSTGKTNRERRSQSDVRQPRTVAKTYQSQVKYRQAPVRITIHQAKAQIAGFQAATGQSDLSVSVLPGVVTDRIERMGVLPELFTAGNQSGPERSPVSRLIPVIPSGKPRQTRLQTAKQRTPVSTLHTLNKLPGSFLKSAQKGDEGDRFPSNREPPQNLNLVNLPGQTIPGKITDRQSKRQIPGTGELILPKSNRGQTIVREQTDSETTIHRTAKTIIQESETQEIVPKITGREMHKIADKVLTLLEKKITIEKDRRGLR